MKTIHYDVPLLKRNNYVKTTQILISFIIKNNDKGYVISWDES